MDSATATRKRQDADVTAMRGGSGDPTFAVALGGGGARGLAHIHVVEALDELGLKPKLIAGSSIGAIIGAGYAAGMRGVEINEYARTILGNRAEVISRIWRSRPGSLNEFISTGFRVTQFNLPRILRSFLPPVLPERFEELPIPLLVTGTDFYGHKVEMFSSGELVSAIAASAALPAVFRPVKRDGKLYVDGGMFDPVPFDAVHGKADIVIAVDVVGAPQPGGKRLSSIDLMYGSTQLMMQAIIQAKLQTYRPQVLLRPPVSAYRVLDFLKVDALMEETASIKEEAKRAVAAAVEAFQRQS